MNNFSRLFMRHTFGANPGERQEETDPYSNLREDPMAPPAPAMMPVPQEAREFAPEQQDNRGFLQRFQETPGMGYGLMKLGAGLAGGRNWGQGIALGFTGMADALQKQGEIDNINGYRQASLQASLAKARAKGADKNMRRMTFTVGGQPVEGYGLVTQDGMSYQTLQGAPIDPASIENAVDFKAPTPRQDTVDSKLFVGLDGSGNPVRGFQAVINGKPSWVREDQQTPIEGAHNMTPFKHPDADAGKDEISRTPVNIRWIDPKSGEERVRSSRIVNGDAQLMDKDGQWVPAHQITGTHEFTFANRSDTQDLEVGAGGIPNAVSYDATTGVPSFRFVRESEAKDYQFALRAIAGNRELGKLVTTQADFDDLTSLGGAVRSWAANNSGDKITATALSSALKASGKSEGDVARLVSSPAFRFLQGVLRVDTGAAYTGTEIQNYWSAFMPVPGDTVDQWYQKSGARQQEIASLVARTGRAAPFLNGVLSGAFPVPGSLIKPQALQGGPANPNPGSIYQPDADLQNLVDNPPW